MVNDDSNLYLSGPWALLSKSFNKTFMSRTQIGLEG